MTTQERADFHKTYLTLKKRFSNYTAEAKTPPISKLSKLMVAAGQVFAKSASLLSLPKPPKWLAPRPVKDVRFRGQEEKVFSIVHWDSYFWSLVVWIGRHVPNSAIDLKGRLNVEPKSFWIAGDFQDKLLPLLTNDITDEFLKSTRIAVAAACRDACEYLITQLESELEISSTLRSSHIKIRNPTGPVSLAHVAKRLTIDSRTLKKRIDQGEISARQLGEGRKWVFDDEQLKGLTLAKSTNPPKHT